MCDCEEMQNHKWEDGDFLIYKRDFQNSDIYHNWCISKGDNDIYRRGNGGNEYVVNEIGAIWLPRQDELQEMIKETHSNRLTSLVSFLYNILNEVESCLEDGCDECKEEEKYWRSFNTFEQLWLAYVMKEKYNKTWDKDKWI